MINWGGLVGIIVFYVLILGVGLWAAWRRKRSGHITGSADEVMLAGRNIGLFVGILTMTATWVGGGYINGSAEQTFALGLVWTQAPFGYATSLMLGGFFFAKKMREQGYTTMLDPLQAKLGRVIGGLLFLPALLGELFWSAAILGALGTTINVILGLDSWTDDGDNLSIVISAAIAVFYTMFGGLLSVAYTDVVQLFCIFIGLWITVPFAMRNSAFSTLSLESNNWMGSVQRHYSGVWIDYAMLLICGGIPWQVYFQRVLSSKSPHRARMLSYAAAFGCVFMAVPAVLIGAIAKGTDWTQTEYGKTPSGDDVRFVLPLVMQYLTPSWVAFIGLGAVSAAVMSSADSSVLSAATMFARNIYKNIFRSKASDREIVIVMRCSILVSAIISTVIAIAVKSIYSLFFLCSDLVFVILFPQLLVVVHFPRHMNAYGSLLAYLTGLTLRLGGGEPLLNLPVAIRYWWYSEVDGQLFPFRTFAMMCSLATLVAASKISQELFYRGILPAKADFLKCFHLADNPSNGLKPRRTTTECRGVDNVAMETIDGDR